MAELVTADYRNLASKPPESIHLLLKTDWAFKYVPALDGLRAVAVLFVMGFHSQGPIAFFASRGGGWVGVDIFFVISGFLITCILLREKTTHGFINLKNFYMRRMLRLMPAYYVFLFALALFNPMQNSHIWSAVGVSLMYLSNYDLVLGWNNVIGSGADITWSLALEEQFYLVWPTLLNCFAKHLFKITACAIVVCQLWKAWLLSHGTSWLYLEAAFDTKLDTIMFGCLAAIAYCDPQTRTGLSKILSSKILPVILFIVLIFYVRAMGHPSGAQTLSNQLLYWDVRMPLFSAMVSVLILSLCIQPQSPVCRLLSTRVFTWIGRLSYSIYLWHGLSFLVLFSLIKHPPEKWILEIMGYTTAILFAIASYYLIESPFLKIKSKL